MGSPLRDAKVREGDVHPPGPLIAQQRLLLSMSYGLRITEELVGGGGECKFTRSPRRPKSLLKEALPEHYTLKGDCDETFSSEGV